MVFPFFLWFSYGFHPPHVSPRCHASPQALPSDNAVAWLASRLLSDADAAEAQKNAAAAAPGAFGVPEAGAGVSWGVDMHL